MRVAAAWCGSSTDARNQPAARHGVAVAAHAGWACSLPANDRRLSAEHDSTRCVRKAPPESAGAPQQALDELAIHRILQVLRSLGQKGEEALPVQLLGALQHHLLILQLHLQGPALLLHGEQSEG